MVEYIKGMFQTRVATQLLACCVLPESLMGSSLLEESEVPSKNLVSISSPPSLDVASLHLPDTESIIGVKEGKRHFLSNRKEGLYMVGWGEDILHLALV